MNNVLFIGSSLSHSLLPLVYELIDEQAQLNLNVVVAEMTEEKVIETMKAKDFSRIKFICFSFPYKILAASLVEMQTIHTSTSNSSNIISKKNEILIGDNTDGQGFVSDLKNRIGFNLANADVLVLGDGGVARGIIPQLVFEGVNHITVCKRKNKRQPNQFMKTNEEIISLCSYESIPERNYNLVINATSASIYKQLAPFILRANAREAFFTECAYSGLGPTIFEDFLRTNEITAYTNGLGMLVDQAVIAVLDQFQVEVDREVVYQKLLKKLMLPVK